MSEIYFAPTKDAAPVTLVQLQEKFIQAGMPCTIEADSLETHWIAFDPHQSTIYASTKDERVTLATLNPGFEDDSKVLSTIERVMDSIGFSADEDADYT